MLAAVPSVETIEDADAWPIMRSLRGGTGRIDESAHARAAPPAGFPRPTVTAARRGHVGGSGGRGGERGYGHGFVGGTPH